MSFSPNTKRKRWFNQHEQEYLSSLVFVKWSSIARSYVSTMRLKHKILTTEREIARLRELWSAGITLEAIAEEFSCSPTAVALACGRLGMRLRQRSPRDASRASRTHSAASPTLLTSRTRTIPPARGPGIGRTVVAFPTPRK
jgi:hypothetical protein